jgi:3,4-dihydroxy 2-butanone 4-phosphate synthase
MKEDVPMPCRRAAGVAARRLRALKCFSLDAARSVSMSTVPSPTRPLRHLPLGHRIGHAIEALRQGRAVVLYDDDDRENEADLVFAAQRLTEPMMALMIRECSGIVCLCIRPDKASELKLRPMVEVNRSRHATAFTQSIEAAFGVSTGVSAADRVQTIQCALRSTLERSEIVSPGHVFPLIARPGGVLERQGHTEAAVDLAVLAGRSPAGVLCELMNPDGSMARGEQVADFARRHGLLCTTVEDIRLFRMAAPAA